MPAIAGEEVHGAHFGDEFHMSFDCRKAGGEKQVFTSSMVKFAFHAEKERVELFFLSVFVFRHGKVRGAVYPDEPGFVAYAHSLEGME